MSLPTPYTLGVRRRVEGAKDAHGNPLVTYADPIDWPVHAIAPGASDMPTDPNRDLSLILWTVYAPAGGNVPGDLDLVVLDGVEYALDSHHSDWTRGPWVHPMAGVSVALKRPEN